MPVARSSKAQSSKQPRASKAPSVTENVPPEKVWLWAMGGRGGLPMGCPRPRITGCVAGGGLPGQALPILAPGGAQEEVSVWGHHQRECTAVLPAPPPRAR